MGHAPGSRIFLVAVTDMEDLPEAFDAITLSLEVLREGGGAKCMAYSIAEPSTCKALLGFQGKSRGIAYRQAVQPMPLSYDT